MIDKKKLLVKRENYKCLEIVTGQQYSMPTESVMNLTNNFSVAFWFKSTDYLPSVNKYIIRRWLVDGDKRVWGIIIRRGANAISAYISPNGTSSTLIVPSLSTTVDNTWHHIVFTFSNGTGVLYIDGTQNAINASLPTTLYNSPTTPFDCKTTVDKTQFQQLKYYNRVLSPEEIYTLYRQYPISRVGLVGEWDMNEPSGNIIRNTSKYGELLDGTTTGTRESVTW